MLADKEIIMAALNIRSMRSPTPSHQMSLEVNLCIHPLLMFVQVPPRARHNGGEPDPAPPRPRLRLKRPLPGHCELLCKVGCIETSVTRSSWPTTPRHPRTPTREAGTSGTPCHSPAGRPPAGASWTPLSPQVIFTQHLPHLQSSTTITTPTTTPPAYFNSSALLLTRQWVTGGATLALEEALAEGEGLQGGPAGPALQEVKSNETNFNCPSGEEPFPNGGNPTI